MSATLRHTEYYNMQATFDRLYERSKANAMNGIDLYDIIISRENIMLAYRNIKSNTGSKTKGCDGLTIANYKIIDEAEFINGIIKCLDNYAPRKVRRVYIEKEYSDKKRPLGIPTMRDRLIQQMFKQVLEPIVEAKFHNHSYGFRPNRSTHHAIARSNFLVNRTNLHYVIDIDVASFFDTVNHRKLIEQLYKIGVKDKRVLTLINRMLKAEIEGEGIPTRGTPAGGILSPLLSNVVLNDLDWWISNQWETFTTKRKYAGKDTVLKTLINYSNLKRMYIVRYADDFKIFTDTYENAQKIYHAVGDYLWNNLHLKISPEKSTITNLRKRSSEFLGFEIKGLKKRKKIVAKSNVKKKKKEKIINTGRNLIKEIRKDPSPSNINRFNTWVLGIHNYYRIATHVSIDFNEIAYRLNRTMYNRFKSIGKYSIPDKPSKTYQKFYGRNNYKTWRINGIHIYPLADIKTKTALFFSQEICNYTQIGRDKIFKLLEKGIEAQIHHLMRMHIPNRSIEYFDNRISKYSMQKGKCAITGQFLLAHEVHCHHIKPIKDGGTDKFDNLIIVHYEIHKLIHATSTDIIYRYTGQLNTKSTNKINKLRTTLRLFPIG